MSDEAEPILKYRLSNVSVLVVDDEPDARALVQLVLQLDGANVETAASVEEALAIVAATPPDVLVSDICMPGGSGYDLIQTLRSLPDAAGAIPAIAMTAFPASENADRALAAGFQAYLSKPFDPYALANVVSQLAGRT